MNIVNGGIVISVERGVLLQVNIFNQSDHPFWYNLLINGIFAETHLQSFFNRAVGSDTECGNIADIFLMTAAIWILTEPSKSAEKHVSCLSAKNLYRRTKVFNIANHTICSFVCKYLLTFLIAKFAKYLPDSIVLSESASKKAGNFN